MTTTENTNTCLSGYGVSCGAEVQLRPDCAIEVAGGMLIFPNGQILHVPQTPSLQFRYYVKPALINERVKKFMFSYLGISKIDEQHMEFLLLSELAVQDDTTDSLKQQHPEDVPEQNLMWNKILVVLALPKEQVPATGNAELQEEQTDYYWLLVSRTALAHQLKIGKSSQTDNQGLFSKPLTRKEVDQLTIDTYLRKVLSLPQLIVPRFGYRQLAIEVPALGLQDNNLHNPFKNINRFADIFFEYKAIIDEFILRVRDALDILHKNFGPVLTHKGKDYLEMYRKILLLKLKMFYDEGDHLYYIQYFYDWLRDLSIAYNELALQLDGFKGGCPCADTADNPEQTGMLLMLGPVLGGKTTYSPLIFRDLAGPVADDRSIREIRCMHWRLMMMIRTFDLPFLHLEKVLIPFGSELGIEEKLDSTDYWEYINEQAPVTPGDPDGLNYLPVKFTPTNGSMAPLGKTAIPYYYPLDSNSIYSLHQFWDYRTTVLRRVDSHLSYNAYLGDPARPVTDTVNDSYTSRIEVILPLAFNLEPCAALRPEGYIGKQISFDLKGPNKFFFKSFALAEYLAKYNLCIDVVAFPLPGGTAALGYDFFTGLEHRPIIEQGKTLVLFFVDSNNEQIELQECKKDETPEIAQWTVVADFVLPYRFTSNLAGLNIRTLVPQIPAP